MVMALYAAVAAATATGGGDSTITRKTRPAAAVPGWVDSSRGAATYTFTSYLSCHHQRQQRPQLYTRAQP